MEPSPRKKNTKLLQYSPHAAAYVLQVSFQLIKQNLSKIQLTSLAIHLVRQWDKSRKFFLKKGAELSQIYSWNMHP